MMRKLIASMALLAALLSLGGVTVQAADNPLFNQVCSGAGSSSSVCKDGGSTQTASDNALYGPNGALTKVTNILAAVVGIIAVIIIIVSGIEYMRSEGDSNKVQSAKNTIIYAAVGLAVVVLARTIIIFVVTRI